MVVSHEPLAIVGWCILVFLFDSKLTFFILFSLFCLIIYLAHVGVDYDGVFGKINRQGHKGSGACCSTAVASMHYVKAVRAGEKIHSPDPSDPIDAQQVFIDNSLLKEAERLEAAEDPNVELPHILFDCADDLMGRIIAKCEKDIPTGTKIALLGGIQINAGAGLPDYFLPKKFQLLDSKGKLLLDLLANLAEEGSKDPRAMLEARKAERMAGKMLMDLTPAGTQAAEDHVLDLNVGPK
jgi:hypothetical protein